MIAFTILALAAVVSALLVVVSRNPIHSTLYLALSFAAIAGVFVILGAQFLAAVQIVLYAGAVLVFFLFVIMLLDLDRLGRLPGKDPRRVQRWLGGYLGLVLLVVLGFAATLAERVRPLSAEEAAALGSTESLGIVLYRDYALPLQLIGVLLTASVIGAVVVSRRR